jgi:sulfite exporter TauE/SafE
MSMLLSMIPLYLVGNLHCAGMCGPLVAFLGRHPHRNAYFFGRLTGFTFAGLIAGEIGFIINEFSSWTSLSSFLTLAISFIFFLVGIGFIFNITLKTKGKLFGFLNKLSLTFSKWMLKDTFFPIFAFGFVTILLPCGQSLLVFTFSALTEDPIIGGLNGFLFALLTTPSLFASMRASYFFNKAKANYRLFMGISLILVSCLTFLRGLADLGVINHLIILQNPHIVLY